MFAIRDWDLDDELGVEAGAKLLVEIMYDCASTEEGLDLITSLKTSFQKITCSLLRHPGESIRKEEFKGTIHF